MSNFVANSTNRYNFGGYTVVSQNATEISPIRLSRISTPSTSSSYVTVEIARSVETKQAVIPHISYLLFALCADFGSIRWQGGATSQHTPFCSRLRRAAPSAWHLVGWPSKECRLTLRHPCNISKAHSVCSDSSSRRCCMQMRIRVCARSSAAGQSGRRHRRALRRTTASRAEQPERDKSGPLHSRPEERHRRAGLARLDNAGAVDPRTREAPGWPRAARCRHTCGHARRLRPGRPHSVERKSSLHRRLPRPAAAAGGPSAF